MSKKSDIDILGIPLFSGSIPSAVDRLTRDCSGPKNNRCISATGAHGLVYASGNPRFKSLLRTFYMNLPDGMPGVWVGRMKGAREMQRCYGPDFFLQMMKSTAGNGIRHFFCGGAEGVASRLQRVCEEQFGKGNICGVFSPPYRDLDDYDYEGIAERINKSGADIVWIGIGTPKQEQFAARLAEQTNVHFLVTVGAAFDFHIGNVRQAPAWMQRSGLEWFFRLCVEPRRLWRRYFVIVPRFIYYASVDMIRYKLRRTDDE